MAVKRKGVSRAKRVIDADKGVWVTDVQPGDGSGTDFMYVRVADRAYYLWIENDMPEQGAMDFWLQAEAEVKRDLQERQGGMTF